MLDRRTAQQKLDRLRKSRDERRLIIRKPDLYEHQDLMVRGEPTRWVCESDDRAPHRGFNTLAEILNDNGIIDF